MDLLLQHRLVRGFGFCFTCNMFIFSCNDADFGSGCGSLYPSLLILVFILLFKINLK